MGCFEHGKRLFFVGFFFQALTSLCFLFGKVARVLRMLVFFFPVFGLCGVAFSCLFGFGRFGCFLCFLFLLFFLVLVLFLFVCFVLFCGWMVFLFLFFVSFFCFVLLFCFGGFMGQVRWPKGPPHLTLNPPYYFCSSFFLFFFCFPFFVLNRKILFLP